MQLVIAVTGLVCAAIFIIFGQQQKTSREKPSRAGSNRWPRRSWRLSLMIMLTILGLVATTSFSHARQPDLATAWQSQPDSSVSYNTTVAKAADQNLRSYALELVNSVRRQRGQGELVADALLDQVAQSHAQDMLQRNYFDHRSPEGEDPRERFVRFGGHRGAGIGENIFYYRDYKTLSPSQEMVRIYQEGWMNSPGHRDNLLFSRWRTFGYGVAIGPDSRQYAVQMFGL